MATELYAQFKLASGDIVQTNTMAPDGSPNWVRITSFDHSVETPVSKDTGVKTGERKHDSMKLQCALEKSAPYFLNAVCQGKTGSKDHQFSEMVVRFYRGDGVHYNNTAMTGVKCVSIRPIMHNYRKDEFKEYPHMMDFEIRYDAIAWFALDGKHQADDAWIGGPDGVTLKSRAAQIAQAGSL